MNREITQLRKRTVQGKLTQEDGSELRSYVKLLGDVTKQAKEIKRANKEAQQEALESMSDEEIMKELKTFLKEKK